MPLAGAFSHGLGHARTGGSGEMGKLTKTPLVVRGLVPGSQVRVLGRPLARQVGIGEERLRDDILRELIGAERFENVTAEIRVESSGVEEQRRS